MRRGKIIAIVALALAGLIVVALVVVAQLDFNRYKPLIAEQVKAATGRTLAIDGDIRLAPSLVPSLAVEKVRFQNAPFGSRPDMITAERLEAAVALLPLLRGEIDIRRVTLIAPDILLETDKTGRGNWEFSASSAPVASSAAPAQDMALPLLGALTIQDGRLTYRDGLSGKATTLEVKRMTAAGEPRAIALEGAYDGTPLALKTVLRLRTRTADFSDVQATFGGSDLAGSAAFDWSGRPSITADLRAKLIDLADFAPASAAAPARRDDGRIFSNDSIDLSALRAYDGKLDLQVAAVRHGKLTLQDMAAGAILEKGRVTLPSFAARFADGALSGSGHLALAGPGLETALVFTADQLDLALLASALDAAMC